VSRGSADAAARLVRLLHETGHQDAGWAAGWAAGLVRLNDPWAAGRLLDAMRAARTVEAIAALVARDPAGQANLGARWDALGLLIALGAAGAADAAEALGARLAERARLDDVPYLAVLLRALGTVRADGAVRALLARDPAGHADLHDPPARRRSGSCYPATGSGVPCSAPPGPWPGCWSTSARPEPATWPRRCWTATPAGGPTWET
jgi:hypothetical protein